MRGGVCGFVKVVVVVRKVDVGVSALFAFCGGAAGSGGSSSGRNSGGGGGGENLESLVSERVCPINEAI